MTHTRFFAGFMQSFMGSAAALLLLVGVNTWRRQGADYAWEEPMVIEADGDGQVMGFHKPEGVRD